MQDVEHASAFSLNTLVVTNSERWSPKIGQCVKVDSRTLMKEDHPNEHYQTQTLFRRI
jgi:hypothetical protein